MTTGKRESERVTMWAADAKKMQKASVLRERVNHFFGGFALLAFAAVPVPPSPPAAAAARFASAACPKRVS